MTEDQTTKCSANDCTREGKPRIYDTGTATFTINLCDDDSWNLAAHQSTKARELVAEMEEEGFFKERHTKGWTYVIRMANGNVKLGMTGKDDLSRLQTISNSQGGVPVQVLAVLKGGSSKELLTHTQWLHLRVSGRMEQFHADPSLLKWAEEQGIHPEAEEAMKKFQAWQENKHKGVKGTKNHAAEQAERLGIKNERLTGEFKTDPRQTEQADQETEADDDDWGI
ncbi:hypothetical protein [Streptomyces poriferorum]|uniref:GIY-YIG nuclease family protein n=1 Tax=Streptomyces poriferorum TaxID=2798799 RepID=A0ABY9IXT0_9ACTN|nr:MULTISPECIES: hypothetical protein [unclassified Streptomyces]MDP5311990.1 hypothetical protein [Streptomyces sp. Alt4]WLQ58949.1 hypothetical protein P8A19_27530 [Streptomyces sp. Alt2]